VKFFPFDDEDIKKLDKLIETEPPPELNKQARWRWRNKQDPDRQKRGGPKK
jgi:hypothetical protein